MGISNKDTHSLYSVEGGDLCAVRLCFAKKGEIRKTVY